MLERFKKEIGEMTPGQKWRLRRFLYRLEERDLNDEEIESLILQYLKDYAYVSSIRKEMKNV